MEPNRRDIETLAAIDALALEHGYAPSLREVGASIGLASTSTVSERVTRLRRMGLATHETGMPRTLALTVAGTRLLMDSIIGGGR